MEIDAANGDIVIRPMTADEMRQREIDQANVAAEQASAAAQAQASSEAKKAAIAHAKSLGFTDAMIAVMYPNLGTGDAAE